MNKRKVLDAARKFAQKGAKEKALKEYATLLKADSRDAKLLLEIGDAHRRWGQNEEAISHYLRVAEQYKQGGFDARAVAVYKQILNLDNKRYPAYVSLAELYQRMGLDAEAVGALQTAADGYHGDGQKPEALELLRKMATLDPSNTTSRMKVAELLRQEELLDDAISEYEAIVEEMVRQGANDALVPVYERILEIRPERADIEFALARNLVQLSQPERAEPFARRCFDQQPEGEGHFDLIVGIYTDLDNADDLTAVTKKMAKNCRDRGEEDQARELMQRLPSGDDFELSSPGIDAATSSDTPSNDDSALEEDGFLDDDFLVLDDEQEGDDDAFLEIDDDEDGDDDGLELETSDDDSSDGDSSIPVGDPDQLFAEASVYLRYGKRDQAIASLEALLAQEPNHRGAIEKIGEFHADGGDTPKAVEYWVQAANLAASAGDESTVENLRERIAVLDPGAAQDLVPDIAPAAPSTAGATAVELIDLGEAVDIDGDADADDDSELEIDVEIETDVEIDIDAFPDSEDDASASVSGDVEAGDEVSFDLEIETDEKSASFTVEVDADEEDKLNETLDGAVFDTSATSSAGASGSGGGVSQGGVTASSSQQINEDIEEAEFYMEQELYDEAEVIFNRVLQVAPNHPSAMLRLGELRAARGEDPEGAGSSAASQNDATLDPTKLPFEESGGDAAEGLDAEASADESSANLGEHSQLEIAVDVDVDVDADVDVDVEIDVDDDAADEVAAVVDEADEEAEEETEDEADGEAEEEPEAEADEEESDEADVEVEAEADTGEVDAAVEQEDDDAFFDLAAELRESIEEEDSREEEDHRAERGETTSAEEGFASIFKDFKSGVEKTLAEDDYETRFDLGIAYRGMELFDDAMSEFQICLSSPGHQLESLHMMGLCAMDLGRFTDASNHIEQALASEDLTPQKEAGLRFDLARSFESQGDFTRAVQALEVARAADPSIPGIDEYLARLKEHVASTSGPVELDEPETEGFENFDDLVAEVEASDAAEESFESFDDVIAEAEASQVAAEAADAAASTKEEVEGPGASGTDKGTKKKKRISFV